MIQKLKFTFAAMLLVLVLDVEGFEHMEPQPDAVRWATKVVKHVTEEARGTKEAAELFFNNATVRAAYDASDSCTIGCNPVALQNNAVGWNILITLVDNSFERMLWGMLHGGVACGFGLSGCNILYGMWWTAGRAPLPLAGGMAFLWVASRFVKKVRGQFLEKKYYDYADVTESILKRLTFVATVTADGRAVCPERFVYKISPGRNAVEWTPSSVVYNSIMHK